MNLEIYENYAEEIVKELAAIQNQGLPNSRTLWTSKIKDVVGKIGKSHEFEICASGFDGDHGEWLYDMVWYKNNSANRLEAAPLVLESEWDLHPYEIRVDFEKLLVANSPLKVMVFQSFKHNAEDTFKNLTDGINEYIHGGTCIYLLACFGQDGSWVEIKTFKKGEQCAELIAQFPSTKTIPL